MKEVISKQLEITPDYTNRSLFPTDNDISNHVHLAKRALAFSKLDQENLMHFFGHMYPKRHPLVLKIFPMSKSLNKLCY